jgi:hypothetical protein
MLLNSMINNQKLVDQTNCRRIDVASVPGLLPARGTTPSLMQISRCKKPNQYINVQQLTHTKPEFSIIEKHK